MTANTAQHLTAARRAGSDRRPSKVTEALNRLHADGAEITHPHPSRTLRRDPQLHRRSTAAAVRHGTGLLEALIQVVTGKPWIPTTA